MHPAPVCGSWQEAAGSRLSFRAEVYEWQIAALLATTRLDEPAKRRLVDALMGTAAPLDTRRIGQLGQELRTLALDNAWGRKPRFDHAAAPWYSWRSPPRRARRRTSRGSTAIGCPAATGEARARARCGRCRL